ncbi:YtpR family tRNA-binding protein [Vagococcus lutrae]|uniref:YtpR family tRNA-binding protein n=1 Tax=Vagococcus lutrae TaxID=81947 RepID=UPI0019277721|nr:DUF4479 and tRNA-binding domain-containing protein [Vagococcus lutrae]MDT2811356.1 DUF4479 and tRNA-binding domain-containing protein [Vagococcus lutrae]MDY3705843.1 DUF4479 and tRNA-binding domain-containing protein [Vagococcus lutrae]UQF71323.1 DUF4479 and tRNA-binding domain-containing protein [Vagococcus lutrae]GEQ61175.1 tRNA binding domain protein [Vagococcus lutrae]GEQ63080.1 tRNA binding domain protein [Vagococcus lutrae]
MIFSYNKEAVGDCLVVVVANAKGGEVAVERVDDVARIYLEDTKETVGLNFFNISKYLPEIEGNGQVYPSEKEMNVLNELLEKAGVQDRLSDNGYGKLVTGYVQSCVPHEDSDHLSVTQTEVANGEVLQIVCGAKNIREGLRVVVAQPGAMMPNGLIIWPGNLRGVDSYGMICSARELGLPQSEAQSGIMELVDETPIGKPIAEVTLKDKR